jgi:hypothetical protein
MCRSKSDANDISLPAWLHANASKVSRSVSPLIAINEAPRKTPAEFLATAAIAASYCDIL